MYANLHKRNNISLLRPVGGKTVRKPHFKYFIQIRSAFLKLSHSPVVVKLKYNDNEEIQACRCRSRFKNVNYDSAFNEYNFILQIGIGILNVALCNMSIKTND